MSILGASLRVEMAGNVPQARQVPWYVPVLAFVGLLAAFPIAILTGHAGYTLLLIGVLPALVLFVARLRATPADGAANSPTSNTSSLLLAMMALAIGLAIVLIGSYFRLFWTVAIIGVALVAGAWKYRSEHSVRGGLAIVGVFVAIYGILGTLVLFLIR